MSELPSVRLTGNPTERGRTHGEAFPEAIRQNVSTYMGRFEHNGVSETEVRDRAAEFLSRMENWNPAYAAELRGVAAGSGVDETDVAALNARYEVLYAAYSEQNAGADGCTSFALLPETTADGHTYVGQNWDWIPELDLLVIDVRPADGARHVALTEAGIVGGKIGVNEHGIGLCINGLASGADGENPTRTPFHVRCREVLTADRLDLALEPIVTEPRACSANFLVGHAVGEMVDVEAAPEACHYVYPEDGLLVHANHFESDAIDSRLERLSPNTLRRAPRLERLLSTADHLDVATLQDALRDHFGRPASICRHPDEADPPDERIVTDASVVLDLTDRRMLATGGPPCEHQYREYALGD